MKTKLMSLVVLLLLAGCATPGPRGRTGDILAGSDARQVALACFVWAIDHNDTLPTDLAALKGIATTGHLDRFELCAGGKLADIKAPVESR